MADNKPTDPQPDSSAPKKFDWSEEMETPTVEKKEHLPQAQTDGAGDGNVEAAQTDGATAFLNGTPGLDEPEFDVNVKLADLQEDPNNPLYSAKHFDELNL